MIGPIFWTFVGCVITGCVARYKPAFFASAATLAEAKIEAAKKLIKTETTPVDGAQ